MSARTLRLAQILIPEDVHRIDIDNQELQDLARSIEQLGLLNPIGVIDNGNDTYTLNDGHRRFLAHQILHRATIDCSIRTGSVRDNEAARFAENMQRAQLSPMEEAYAIKHQNEANLIPVHELARMLHRSVEWVDTRLFLTQMHPELCELVHRAALPIGSALALATVKDDTHRRYLTTYAINAGAAVSVIREWVRQWQLHEQLGATADAPRPEMPPPGEAVVVTMPCYICATPHPYQHLRVARICIDCTAQLEVSNRLPAAVIS